MKRTKQVTPEIQLKAEQYINLGYQRLLTFEVPGGGFDWYGRAPSNIILSAWGLLQLNDMANVWSIDRRILDRTKQYLFRNQQQDGRWDLSLSESRQGSYNWGQVTGSLPVTAYVTWALLEAGDRGTGVQRAVAYIRKHIGQSKDPYTLALAANALVLWSPRDDFTGRLLQRLDGLKTPSSDGKTVSWTAQTQTMYYSSGLTGSLESTALAAIALGRARAFTTSVNRGLLFLVKSKDPHGTWFSTQATILSLKALLGASQKVRSDVTERVSIAVDGKEVKQLTITPDQSDILQLVDLKPFVGRAGVRRVSLASSRAETNLMYQVVGRTYLPWHLVPKKEAVPSPMRIDLRYDRTWLRKDDTLTAQLEVEYLGERPTYLVIVDLGIPPGFDLLPERLVKAREQGGIDKFTATGRQLTLYLGRMAKGKPLKLSYQLKARFPIRAKTPRSVAYEYYNPKNQAVAAPVSLTVQ